MNFAAADTGTLWLLENEGNGGLTTSVPDVHIAIMGMEKVVAKLDHIVPLASGASTACSAGPRRACAR